jgi:hypothetical protein
MPLDKTLFKSVVVRFEGVLETFVNAVNAFNDNDLNRYQTFLDPNAVAYNLSVVGYTTGRDKIVEYFRSISEPGNPSSLQFVPTNNITWFPGMYPLSVKGVALWTHKSSHHVRVPIKYAFQFYPGNSFLLTSVWGQHLEGD